MLNESGSLSLGNGIATYVDRLRRAGAAQQPLSAQVFINVGPMDAIATARQLPVTALLWRSVG
jgi:hypothetical protein